MTLDERLSAAQFYLRDGCHDNLSNAVAEDLSNAVAEARNLLNVGATDDRRALQQVMQVLGPDGVPAGVDYGDSGNIAGLSYDVDEALRIIRARGIEFKVR